MDAPLRAFGGWLEPWRSLSPAARWGIGLCGLIAAVAVGCYWTHDAEADVELMPGTSVSLEKQSAMMWAFAKAGLAGHEVRGTSIWVPRSRREAYLAALAEAGLLRDIDAPEKELADDNPFWTPEQRREKYKRALQAKLAHLIRAMRGVENAEVLYAEDIKRGFNEQKLVTATVGVKLAGARSLDEMRISEIRRLVSGAIPGLTPEHVTVCDLNGPCGNGPADAHADNGHYASPQPPGGQEPNKTAFHASDQPGHGAAWTGWNRETLKSFAPACAAIAAVGLVLLCWQVLRSIGNRAAATDRPEGSIAAEDDRSPVGPPHWRRDAGPPHQRPSEELSALVAEDPDAAANVLRNWIGPVD